MSRGVFDIVENLAEAFAEATGESMADSRHDVLSMCIGSISVQLGDTPREHVVRATELVRSTMKAMLADLHSLAEPASL